MTYINGAIQNNTHKIHQVVSFRSSETSSVIGFVGMTNFNEFMFLVTLKEQVHFRSF